MRQTRSQSRFVRGQRAAEPEHELRESLGRVGGPGLRQPSHKLLAAACVTDRSERQQQLAAFLHGELALVQQGLQPAGRGHREPRERGVAAEGEEQRDAGLTIAQAGADGRSTRAGFGGFATGASQPAAPSSSCSASTASRAAMALELPASTLPCRGRDRFARRGRRQHAAAQEGELALEVARVEAAHDLRAGRAVRVRAARASAPSAWCAPSAPPGGRRDLRDVAAPEVVALGRRGDPQLGPPLRAAPEDVERRLARDAVVEAGEILRWRRSRST